MIAPEILAFYAEASEEDRLTRALGRLERIRTWEILERHLPPAPARILDVGGGTGVYAIPLARRGYEVHLIDPVPVHVARARALSAALEAPLASAVLGDARALHFADGTFDMVLQFGPLYHLPVPRDRIDVLAEARRVLVDGGTLLAAYISRFASALDGIHDGDLRDAMFAAIVDRDLADGVHNNATNRPDWFTTAYFHRPEEIRAEIEDVGLRFAHLLAVEGAGWMTHDLDAWLEDDVSRERLLRIVRRLEAEPSLIGASAHIVAVAHR
jgi:SAM-dependent methyltransferase